MDSPVNMNAASGKSTSRVISNFHSMPWLKHQKSSSQNCNGRRAAGKDGKILALKKTDEDYFSGTREDKKKVKKRKEKKGKPVLTIDNIEELINLTNQKAGTVPDLKAAAKLQTNLSQPIKDEEKLLSTTNSTLPSHSVWSTTASTANKLFPNVKSVIIDRMEEEEMMTRAIAESIATVQLEQFNRPSSDKENRWDAIYGDTSDEDGWDNVRRNLPELEGRNLEDDASCQRDSCDDNNNNSDRSVPGILRNKDKNVNRLFMEPETLDFCFKKCSESSKDEIQAVKSSKSVSFNNVVVVKPCSTVPSESNRSIKISSHSNEKEPIIDKFGRVDGYSERRLFMGKGARIKEQEYIKSKCSIGVHEARSRSLESNSPAESIAKAEKPIGINLKCPKSLDSQKPTSNLQEPKMEQIDAAKNVQRICKTPENLRNGRDTVKKLVESVVKSPQDKFPRSKSPTNSKPQASATNSKPQASTTRESKLIENETQASRAIENTDSPQNKVCNSQDVTQSEMEQANCRKTDLVSSGPQTVVINNHKPESESKTTLSLSEIEIPLKRMEIICEKNSDAKNLQQNIWNQDIMAKDSPIMLTIVDNDSETRISENDSTSDGHCLVPTLIREDGYAPDFRYANSGMVIPSAGFQSPAHQNLLLAGVSYSVENLHGRSSVTCDAEAQGFNNMQRIHENPSVNALPYHSTYSVPPSSFNMENEPQIYDSQYEHFAHHLDALNLQYQNNNNKEQLLSAKAAPGLIKNLRLPPGFTKKQNADNSNLFLNVTAVTQDVEDVKFGEGKVCNKEPVQQGANDFHNTSMEYLHCERNSAASSVQTKRSPSKKQQNYYRSQTGFARQDAKTAENQKPPHPNMRRLPNSRDKYRDINADRKREKLNSGNSFKLPNSSQSALSQMSRWPDQQVLEPRNVTSWQCNRNFMYPSQVQMNFVPGYQIPQMPGPYYPQLNKLQAPMYPNMLTSAPPPMYSMPPSLNAEVSHASFVEMGYGGVPQFGAILQNPHADNGRGRGRLTNKDFF